MLLPAQQQAAVRRWRMSKKLCDNQQVTKNTNKSAAVRNDKKKEWKNREIKIHFSHKKNGKYDE